MRTVNKIILFSCIFCYFAGLYLIALKFGLIKLLVRYEISEWFNEVPKDFPQIKYLYIGLAVYTVFFLMISIIIMRTASRHGDDMEQLQGDIVEVNNFSEDINALIRAYKNVESANVEAQEIVLTKLRALQRQIAALPPAVVQNDTMRVAMAVEMTKLNDIIANRDESILASAIDGALETMKALQRQNVNRKY